MQPQYETNQSLIRWEFFRDFVAKKQFGFFLDIWAPDKLLQGPALRPMLNSLAFHLQGYDDPRQVCTVPEARAFYQAFFEAWPFWFFSSPLTTPTLLIMALACLRKLRVIDQEASGFRRVQIDLAELHEFIERGLCAMTCLCQRADMSESEIGLRTMLVL